MRQGTPSSDPRQGACPAPGSRAGPGGSRLTGRGCGPRPLGPSPPVDPSGCVYPSPGTDTRAQALTQEPAQYRRRRADAQPWPALPLRSWLGARQPGSPKATLPVALPWGERLPAARLQDWLGPRPRSSSSLPGGWPQQDATSPLTNFFTKAALYKDTCIFPFCPQS